jgi:hypothetical protein
MAGTGAATLWRLASAPRSLAPATLLHAPSRPSQVLPSKGAGPRAMYAALGGKLPPAPAAPGEQAPLP